MSADRDARPLSSALIDCRLTPKAPANSLIETPWAWTISVLSHSPAWIAHDGGILMVIRDNPPSTNRRRSPAHRRVMESEERRVGKEGVMTGTFGLWP